MGSVAIAQKAKLREEVNATLAGLSEQYRNERSKKACELVSCQAAWTEANSILFYAPIRGELDVWPLLKLALSAGKTVALPQFNPAENQYIACNIRDPGGDMEIGCYGIREPKAGCDSISLKRLDFVLVPGVAFDLHGRRLGRGKGFYDRLLATVRGKTCGVAFDEQIVREVPVEPHDSDVNCILTPTRWIEL
jgi:5-formyltetrahydrofolate cyclo-ligase